VLLDTYCVTCHNQQLKTAGLTLDAVSLDRVPDSAEVWEKVLRKVRTGAMPPPGRPRPDHASLTGFADWVEATLDRSAIDPNPGRATVHRLSRVEYGNAVRDLLNDVDVRALPPDDAAYG
jgi:mono/diheme cytochrome c family protein